MSNKKRKIKKNPQRVVKPKRVLTSQQNSRLQRAIQAQSVGNFAFAEADYRSLIAEKIRTPQIFCNLAAICAQSARRDEANSLWKQALALSPRFLEAQMNLADSLQNNGEIEQAENLYRRIVSDHSQVVAAKYLLANLLKSKGEFSKASDLYQQVMAQQPDYTQAHFSYSGIHKYRDETDHHIGLMLGIYQKNGLKKENRIQLAFALAKAFEDIGDYPQSFKYLKSGNDLRHKEFNDQIESDRDLIQSIIRNFSHEAMSRIQIDPETSNKPIFIVGMPRSGSSLVEKIISSHHDVYGAGELDYIFSLGARLFLNESRHFQFGPLDSYSKQSFELFGKSYLEQIDLLDHKSSRMTDKMPFNMMMLGLIKVAFPNAKIVHCVRDAKDCCLSIYKQNFTTGNYRFAYDLKTVGQFHKQYQLLMNHWHQAMPGVIYDVSYEALTHNPEFEIRSLLAACDLEWQDDCLNFYKTEGVIKTASAYQARQPMYRSSVKLWEKYQEFL
ncbi:MAG: tetratricopeptide repeat protein, partial [Xanthomonadales bacterium]|nr:tetratricopeptide repeat protein [Xanthomonadales bacterium]